MDWFKHMLSELRHRIDPGFEWSYQLVCSLFLKIRNLELIKASNRDTWRHRQKTAATGIMHFFGISLTYLLSEVVVWGLSRALATIKIEFFSAIISMLLIFICMGVASLAWRPVEKTYQRWIKPRVDFINIHMGIGFSVPIVMLNEDDILDGRDIACILGNAVVTNLVSWASVFLVSYFSWSLYLRTIYPRLADSGCRGVPKRVTTTPSHISLTWYPDANSDQVKDNDAVNMSKPETATHGKAAAMGTNQNSVQSQVGQSLERRRTCRWSCNVIPWPIALAFICVFLIGAPVAASTNDSRLLDASVLWLVWISAIEMQRTFKASARCLHHLKLKNVAGTLMNPVLISTLTMVAYTRVRAQVRGEHLANILEQFSAGSPLYALWTAKVRGVNIPANPRAWFGAGDAALSLLECGIFVWGFKLFECRQQLFSMAGALAIVVSVVAAVGNVLLSVMAGKAMGLERREALAFAARSATLALAKPAIEAVGGNTVVNAALVVGNGILGQLMYPFALNIMCVKSDIGVAAESVPSSVNSCDVEKSPGANDSSASGPWASHDDAATVASGIAIGINGAAMGVAYLYETRSRAAPYAALSMTVFGVVTVILTTVGPFKALVVGLAGS